ncbi:MAG: hypothetical protein K2R98_29380 [Gemmataceae bacterium]|nr:hypothetical protein [Gemmataceae bacterium]
MLAVFGFYLGAHLTLYLVLCRHLAAFQRERVIFLYHALPAACVAALCAAAVLDWPSVDTLAQAVIVVGIQGIYSLSFLELWSLSQIGYSLGILMAFEAGRQSGDTPDLRPFEAMGEQKKAGRIEGLTRLGLVNAEGQTLQLTPLGKIGTAALRALGWWINLRRTV